MILENKKNDIIDITINDNDRFKVKLKKFQEIFNVQYNNIDYNFDNKTFDRKSFLDDISKNINFKKVLEIFEELLEKNLVQSKINFLISKYSLLSCSSFKNSAYISFINALKVSQNNKQFRGNYLSEFSDSINFFEKSVAKLKQNKLEFDFNDIHNITFHSTKNQEDNGFLEETFIYKSIIERFTNQVEIFDKLLQSLKEEQTIFFKLTKITKTFNEIKDLKKIHMYLMSISLNGFLNIKDKSTNISLISNYIDQINGIIREIENKKKNVNKLIKKHEMQGNLNKFEFLVFINIVALQDLAYSKKEILEALLLFSNK